MGADFNHFAQIGSQLRPVLSRVVRKTAFDMVAQAQAGAPVDTGFLKNSIYAVTSEKSTYGGAVQVAKLTPNKSGFISRRKLQNFVKKRARQRGQEAMMLPQVAGVSDELTAYVAVGASYGIYVEMGTTRMPARPYFYPAVEAVRPGFEAALSAVESKLG